MSYIKLSGVDEAIFHKLAIYAKDNNSIKPEYYDIYDIKRGLRNSNGTGVLVGITEIGEVRGYDLIDNKKIPEEGKLYYRSIELKDLVEGVQKEKRFGFEECIYLLIFGQLPTKEELNDFNQLLGKLRFLPEGFNEKMILLYPSKDVMNQLQRSVLSMYTYDESVDENSISNLTSQSLNLIAKLPALAIYSYQAKIHNYDKQSLFIHPPQPHLSTAENILYMTRADSNYTELEAEVLDLSLIVHAEHGGGNNSSFTTHVLASSGTDSYSVIAAAIGSLKGSKHGGANFKVYKMIEAIKEELEDFRDRNELKNYLRKILKKEAFDKQGLVYGMGHAVYTKSDPRAVLLKKKAEELAKDKGLEDDYNLYANIEDITKELFVELKGENACICANVDLYSSFVYRMLGLPFELFTPIFAIARMAGWCAHRIEQVLSDTKIIRPAYKSVTKIKDYVPLDER